MCLFEIRNSLGKFKKNPEKIKTEKKLTPSDVSIPQTTVTIATIESIVLFINFPFIKRINLIRWFYLYTFNIVLC